MRLLCGAYVLVIRSEMRRFTPKLHVCYYGMHMMIQDIQAQRLHHTYIVSGDRQSALPEILSFIEKDCGMSVHGNSDVFVKEYDSFYIDDTRDIRNLQQQKTLDATQFFVLSMKSITNQAQNAFLKIAEDPSVRTCFFILLPNHEVLLPTLKSRAVLIEHRGGALGEYKDLVTSFLAGTPKERLSIVEKFHPKNKDEIDKEQIGKFLSELEVSVSDRRVLRDIYDVKKKLLATGVSVKTLLEHLSMVVPYQK